MNLLRTTTSPNIAGTKTFRLGCRAIFSRKPEFKGYGTNLQNRAPIESRIYVPSRPGYCFLQADQAGAEALRVAYLTRHAKFRDLFINGIKPHVYIGLSFPQHWRHMFPDLSFDKLRKTEIKDLKSLPEWKPLSTAIKDSDGNPPRTRYYYVYKQACHSGNYGVEANAFQLNTLKKSEGSIYLSLAESAAYIESYHTLFPEIREWQKEVRLIVDTTRTVRNAFGYPRYFGGPITDKMYKEAYAQDPQSTIGTITNIAYTQLQRLVDDSGAWWNILVNKHDSILMEVPEEESEIAGRILQSSLEQDMIGRDGVKFRMKTELAKGYNWGKYHETQNPKGMKEWILPTVMMAA